MKYFYGMRARGVSPGAQPKGMAEFYMDQSVPPKYWNIIVYSRPLADDEVRNYELDFIKSE